MLEIERELATTRLLTLTGVGGSGKTRLALEVVRELLEVYPDGAWLVELASLSEGELVPQAVAAALDLREQPGLPLTDALGPTPPERIVIASQHLGGRAGLHREAGTEGHDRPESVR